MFSWRCFPFVESAPRAYRLKASNAAPLSSTSAGTFPQADAAGRYAAQICFENQAMRCHLLEWELLEEGVQLRDFRDDRLSAPAISKWVLQADWAELQQPSC
jgi:hypothetical protein